MIQSLQNFWSPMMSFAAAFMNPTIYRPFNSSISCSEYLRSIDYPLTSDIYLFIIVFFSLWFAVMFVFVAIRVVIEAKVIYLDETVVDEGSLDAIQNQYKEGAVLEVTTEGYADKLSKVKDVKESRSSNESSSDSPVMTLQGQLSLSAQSYSATEPVVGHHDSDFLNACDAVPNALFFPKRREPEECYGSVSLPLVSSLASQRQQSQTGSAISTSEVPVERAISPQVNSDVRKSVVCRLTLGSKTGSVVRSISRRSSKHQLFSIPNEFKTSNG
eukprot:Tbor_TRINITY_DN5691_c2_g1::TRINITY_DN5691_c2_g1_i1::g.8939::m.8939